MSEFPRNKTLRKLLIDLSFLSCQPHKAVHHTKQFMKLHSDHMADILPTLIHSKKNYPQNLEISLLIIEIYSHLKEWLPCLDELQPLLKDLQHVPILLPILSNILSHEPQHYLANLFAGDAWQLQDQIEKTLHHYAQIVDVSKSEEVEIRLKNLHPKYPEHQDYITLLLAKIRFQNADHNAALSLAKSIQNSSESLEVYLLKTAIFSKRNQYETSFTILHEALSQFPDHSLIHQTLFNTFHQCCESQIEKITGTSNLYNNRNKYHEDLGFIYLNHAQLLEAITNFQKIDTPKKTLDQYLLLGRCFLEYNRFDTALEQFQSCIQQSAQEPEIQRLCHYYITLCFFYLGKFSNSTPHIEWIMNQMPQYHEIKSLETFEKKAQEQVSKGRCLFGVFHTLDSKSPSFKCALPTQFKGKKTKQAFLHTLSFSETHNEQGVEYALQNQYKLAEEEFIHAINMDSNCFMAHFNLTFLYLNMGKFEPAKTHRDICQHIDKTHPYLPCLSALLALKEDNWKQAQKALEMIHTDELHFGIGQLLLGDIQYRYLHNIELAKKYWQTAIKHCPHFFPLIQRRYQYQQLPQSQLDAWIQPRSDF